MAVPKSKTSKQIIKNKFFFANKTLKKVKLSGIFKTKKLSIIPYL